MKKVKHTCESCQTEFEAIPTWPCCPSCGHVPKKHWDKNINPHWDYKEAKIPFRHKDCTIENFVTESKEMGHAKATAKKFCTKFPSLLKSGIGGLIFHGKVGTGKTHLACGMLTELALPYKARVRYTNVFDYIQALRATWSRQDRHEQEVVNNFASYHLLVIDEIGVQYGTKAEVVQLFQLINQRSQAKLPTILISNLDEQELIDVVGEAVVDRIFENNGGMVAFTWGSKRR